MADARGQLNFQAILRGARMTTDPQGTKRVPLERFKALAESAFGGSQLAAYTTTSLDLMARHLQGTRTQRNETDVSIIVAMKNDETPVALVHANPWGIIEMHVIYPDDRDEKALVHLTERHENGSMTIFSTNKPRFQKLAILDSSNDERHGPGVVLSFGGESGDAELSFGGITASAVLLFTPLESGNGGNVSYCSTIEVPDINPKEQLRVVQFLDELIHTIHALASRPVASG